MQFSQSLRVALTVALSFILSACYFIPGQFDASLDIRRDGTFRFRYVGEFVFPLSRNKPENNSNEAEFQCYDDIAVEYRSCNAAETVTRRRDFEERQRIGKKESDEFAVFIGYNVDDEAANAMLAKRMMQSKGWKTVIYKGSGIYQVEYETTGILDRDVLFPVLAETHISAPFVIIRPSPDGNVEVNAPGLASGLLRQMIVGNEPMAMDFALFNPTRGTFTVTTDAEITSTNGDIGKGQKAAIHWQILDGKMIGRPTELPKALLRLPQPN
jgi:hypothetical protein